MTQQEMIELVQQHHPHMGETEIEKILLRAYRDFAMKTSIHRTSFTLDGDTVANQRYYALPSNIDKIYEVTLSDGDGNEYFIPRSLSKPSKDDIG